MSSPLNNLVNNLTRSSSQKQRKQRNTRKKNPLNRDRGTASRGMRVRDPGTRTPTTRRDNMLDLTRDQFTATSPLNLFTIATGSTPGGIRVRGRELVGAATAQSASTGAIFNLLVNGITPPFYINPVNFPRLSAYLPIYEWYKFHKVSVLFQANQPTTAVGELLMCVDYDAKDATPATAVAFMRNITSTMCNIYSDASCQVLGSLSRLPKFATAQGTSSDLDQVNQASLFLAGEGITTASGAGLGYVILQYDIEFFTPQ